TEANARLSLRPGRVCAPPSASRPAAAAAPQSLFYDGFRPWPPGPLFMADDQLRRPSGGGTSRRGVERQHRAATPATGEGPNGRPQLHKPRLVITLIGLTVLALVSTVFGMMMAVAQDLPE